jgi:hypothetical protein
MAGKGDRDRTADHGSYRSNYDKAFIRPFCFGWQSCDLEYRKYCKHREKCKKEADNGVLR